MAEGSGRVFGIDLGTTYSVVAYVDATGRPVVCRNGVGAEATPSVVFFENATNIIVGETAKRSAMVQADRVIELIKRQMGRAERYEFDGVEYTPESISALILKQLTQDAAAYTQGPVQQVVITVPAYFGMQERQATKQAGEIAGLDVLGIVPEPVAAAVHYELTSAADGRTVLVYDLGGGTFDTSVIRVADNEITVVCTDGDSSLGGADWDARLRRYLLDQFRAEAHPAESPEDDEEFLQELTNLAEEVKKHLTVQMKRPVPLRFAGAAARIDVERSKFEEITTDLLDRTIEIVRRTLATLGEKLPGATVDEVLLVGGSTRMPAVRARLAKEFGWDPKLHDPDLAVAKGAAVYALGRIVHREIEQAAAADDSENDVAARSVEIINEVADRTSIPRAALTTLVAKKTNTVLPKAFGIKLVDSSDPDWRTKPPRFRVEHLVHANELLPTGDKYLRAETVDEGQTSVEVELYEQAGIVASERIEDNKPVSQGSGVIAGIPPLPAQSPIDIRMSVDEEGLLQMHATEPVSGRQLDIQVSVSVLSDAEVVEAAKMVAGLTVSG
jgi:molecular chaperone DnaK